MSNGVIKKKTVVYEVVDRLVSFIQSGAFPPGTRLPSERQLCETFQVSRSSLRTALQQLAYNGVVEIKQGSGTYVCENAASLIEKKQEKLSDIICFTGDDEDNFISRMECRMFMEPVAARLAAIYATDEDLCELKEIISRMEVYVNSTQTAGFYVEDQNFHDCIARASKNAMIREIINNYCVSVYYHLRSFGRIPQLAEKSLEQHRMIVNAIEMHDAEAAETAMQEHIMYSFHENARYVYNVKPEFREGIKK